jgi:hypothetical protein
MSDRNPKIVETQELNILDDTGTRRLSLSARGGSPSIQMFTPEGRASLSMSLDAEGRASLHLGNSNDSGPTAVIEVVQTGTHVKFMRPAGGASYLFLNNAGGSGVVLIDTNGKRRVQILAPADGSVKIEKYDPEGNLLP